VSFGRVIAGGIPDQGFTLVFVGHGACRRPNFPMGRLQGTGPAWQTLVDVHHDPPIRTRSTPGELDPAMFGGQGD